MVSDIPVGDGKIEKLFFTVWGEGGEVLFIVFYWNPRRYKFLSYKKGKKGGDKAEREEKLVCL